MKMPLHQISTSTSDRVGSSCKVSYHPPKKDSDTVAAQVSIRWVDKTTIGQSHNGILSSCKKEENFTIWHSMDGPGKHYATWNKPARERQVPYVFNYVWNLMNKQIISKIETDPESRLTALGRRGWRG